MRAAASRRWLPRAAFCALFVVHSLASGAGEPASGDIKDTHQRLDAIYKRLGIKRQADPAPPKKNKAQGCSCNRELEQREPSSRRDASVPAPTPLMPPALGYILIGLIIAVMLIPLYLALRSSYQRSSQPLEPEVEEESRASDQPVRGPWVVDLAACRALLEAGRTAEAFAALHRAFLLGLAAERHVALDAKTTNWEYVRRLSSRPQLRQVLAAVTLAAEASVLGRHPPQRDHYFVLEQRVVAAAREGTA